MKRLYFLFALFTIGFLHAQTDEFSKEQDQIVNAEKKGAAKRMTFITNPNTNNYDITYHKIEVTVDPAIYSVSGKVTTTYTALATMSTIYFDLSDALTVSSVKKNNVNLSFVQDGNNQLIVTIPSQATGTSATLEITYSGTPSASGFGSFVTDTHGSANTPVLWTLSEPFGAMEWWPCKQDLNDKINTIDVYITAPSQYVSVSNGLNVGETTSGSMKTTHFHHGYPIPAYLIAIACTNYQIHNQQGGLGTVASPNFPIINYYYPETATAHIASLAPTPDIINFYESVFTPYPFRNEKYGHAQFGWGGGMEHTTVSFMTAGNTGAYSRGLIAHEMGHQWFGDKVTCGSWKDIWLNEGFATYLASMVIQNFDGETAFTSNKNSMINSITSNSGGAVYLTDTEALDVNRIFSGRLSYNKGAMVLNMLRVKLGDTNFFQGLKDYLNDSNLAYAYAVTPDLQAHLETASGQSLTEFFNDWIYNQGYPTYTISAGSISSTQAQIVVNQTQSHPSVSFFEGPVPVRLLGSGGQQQDYLLDNSTNGQAFVVNCPFTVTSVQFDPKKDIISKNNTATLGSSSFVLESLVSIYPNPANSVLNVQLPDTISIETIEIYNTIGQKVISSQLKSIDVSALQNGIYTIEVRTNEGSIHKKFIKQ